MSKKEQGLSLLTDLRAFAFPVLYFRLLALLYIELVGGGTVPDSGVRQWCDTLFYLLHELIL